MENTQFVQYGDNYPLVDNNSYSYGSRSFELDSYGYTLPENTTIVTRQLESYSPSIVFNSPVDNKEMIKICKDGFFVRCQKLDQDESEARKLFDAMTEYFQLINPKQ